MEAVLRALLRALWKPCGSPVEALLKPMFLFLRALFSWTHQGLKSPSSIVDELESQVILFLHHPFLPYVAHPFPPYFRI